MVHTTGDLVWIPAEDAWALATVMSSDTSTATVLLQDGEQIVVAIDDVYKPAYPFDQAAGVRDMTTMSQLHEADMLHNLSVRAAADEIYTYVGPVLVAVNPFKNIPGLYTNEMLWKYAAEDRDLDRLPPHPFAIADRAYRAMLREQKDQAFIVTGESGAGKTEMAKLLLFHFTSASSVGRREETTSSTLEEKLLWSSEVMEAFGNARTLRNMNSSRFGKITKLAVNADGKINGGMITTYMLEKSRITKLNEGERNYHIFYYLVEGLEGDDKRGMGLLERAELYKYLHNTKSMIDPIPFAISSKMLKGVQDGLGILGFGMAEQRDLFAVVAGIMLLGNVEMKPMDGFADGTAVANPRVLQQVAMYFGVNPRALINALTTRILTSGSRRASVIHKPLNAQAAATAVGTFSKYMYSRLFARIVDAVNVSIQGVRETPTYASILDIFGFENFKTNSFEQFCINYANEKLQQLFVNCVFATELSDYEAEGLDVTHLDFSDNAECLALIEHRRTGIIAMINEEGRIPNGSDDSLLRKLHVAHETHKHYAVPRAARAVQFAIHHYAETVFYSVDAFLEKNNEIASPQIAEILVNSTNELAKSIGRSDTLQSFSVAQDFKASLSHLIGTLSSADPHFIRCVKPNDSLMPDDFDKAFAMRQLRSLGLLDTIRVKSAGYPAHIPMHDFCASYSWLVPGSVEQNGLRHYTIAILEKAGGQEGIDWQLGRTKVFAKTHVMRELEVQRARLLQGAVIVVQRFARVWLARRIVERLREKRKEALRQLAILEEKKRREEEQRKQEEARRQRAEEDEERRRAEEARQREEEQKQKEAEQRRRHEEAKKAHDEEDLRRQALQKEQARAEASAQAGGEHPAGGEGRGAHARSASVGSDHGLPRKPKPHVPLKPVHLRRSERVSSSPRSKPLIPKKPTHLRRASQPAVSSTASLCDSPPSKVPSPLLTPTGKPRAPVHATSSPLATSPPAIVDPAYQEPPPAPVHATGSPLAVPPASTAQGTCQELCGGESIWDARGFLHRSLDITVSAAKDLAKKQQCYCKVLFEIPSIKGKKTIVTRQAVSQTILTLSCTTEPHWEEKFALKVPFNAKAFVVMLLNASDHVIGEFLCPLDLDEVSAASQTWLPLRKKKKVVGKLKLDLKYAREVVRGALEYRKFVTIIDKEFQVFMALSSCLESTEREVAAGYVICVYAAQGRLLEFFQRMISLELHGLEDSNVIFRGNTLCTKAIEMMMRFTGHDFLVRCLGGLVDQICQDTESCEINPTMMTDASTLPDNLRRLNEHVNYALKGIVALSRDCPPVFRFVFKILVECVGSKGSQAGWSAEAILDAQRAGVGGFIFLRFMVLGLLNPTRFGLRDSPPTPIASRTLTLVGKVLQNLSNLKNFGRKEPYMIAMNTFIESNKGVMCDLLDSLSRDLPPGELNTGLVADFSTNAALLHKLFEKHEEGMQHRLSEFPHCPAFTELFRELKRLRRGDEDALLQPGIAVKASTSAPAAHDVGALMALLAPAERGGMPKREYRPRAENLMFRVRFPEKGLVKTMVLPKTATMAEVKASVGVKLFMDKRDLQKYCLFVQRRGGEGGHWCEDPRTNIDQLGITNAQEILLLPKCPDAPGPDTKNTLQQKFLDACIRKIEDIKSQRQSLEKLITVSDKEMALELRNSLVRCDVQLTLLHRQQIELERILRIDMSRIKTEELLYRMETVGRLLQVRKVEMAGVNNILNGFTKGSPERVPVERQLEELRKDMDDALAHQRELRSLMGRRESNIPNMVTKGTIERQTLNLDPAMSDPLRKRSPGGVRHTALFAFTARDDQELSLHAGDEVIVYNSTDSVWWYGERKGSYGAVPATYLNDPD